MHLESGCAWACVISLLLIQYVYRQKIYKLHYITMMYIYICIYVRLFFVLQLPNGPNKSNWSLKNPFPVAKKGGPRDRCKRGRSSAAWLPYLSPDASIQVKPLRMVGKNPNGFPVRWEIYISKKLVEFRMWQTAYSLKQFSRYVHKIVGTKEWFIRAKAFKHCDSILYSCECTHSMILLPTEQTWPQTANCVLTLFLYPAHAACRMLCA